MFVRRPGPAVMLTVWSVLAVTLIVLDARFNTLAWLRSAVSTLFYPVQTAIRAPFEFAAEVSAFLVRHEEIKEENERLKANQLLQSAKLASFNALQAENDELRRQQSLRMLDTYQSQPAEILSTPRDPFSRRIMLDRGENAGVMPGQPVVDSKGLVGQVTRVFPWSSEVTLISDREQAVPAQVQRTGQRVLVFGGSGQMEVRYLPSHTDVVEGDVLVTSGIDRIYPPGLAVAKVISVKHPADNPYARVGCQPIGGVEKSRVLLVLKQTSSRITP